MAKIGDFGLARDVYKYQKYSKKSSVSVYSENIIRLLPCIF